MAQQLSKGYIQNLMQGPQEWVDDVSSEHEFHQVEVLYASINALEPFNGATDGCPRTPEACNYYVQLLFNAIIDYTEAVEANTNVQLQRLRQLSGLEVKLIAWRILLAARDAQDGILGFGPWIKTKQPDWRFERYNSFGQRFEQIEYNCRHSKSIVYGFITTPFNRRLAAGPAHEMKSKESNKRLNDKRGATLKQVTKANKPEAIPPPAGPAAASSSQGNTRSRTLTGRVGARPAAPYRKRNVNHIAARLPLPTPAVPNNIAPNPDWAAEAASMTTVSSSLTSGPSSEVEAWGQDPMARFAPAPQFAPALLNQPGSNMETAQPVEPRTHLGGFAPPDFSVTSLFDFHGRQEEIDEWLAEQWGLPS